MFGMIDKIGSEDMIDEMKIADGDHFVGDISRKAFPLRVIG